MSDTTPKLAKPLPLVPERYPQMDLFICDVADAVLKDIAPHMEHPFYSLTKKPEKTARRYEHNGNWLEVKPGYHGLATIYDKDILIYCISQLMAKINRGEPASRKVRITARDLLMFTNRGTAGKDYAAICDALERLAGTQISTNIRSGDEEEYTTFTLIDKGQATRQRGKNGRLKWVDVTLSDWVFEAIENENVLTMNRDFFRLRKPIERRVYELARKHCGYQPTWSIRLELLHKKSGSKSALKEFRRAIKHLVENDHLPDYTVTYDREKDQVIFSSRPEMRERTPSPTSKLPALSPGTYEKARSVAPRFDIYALEAQWKAHWEKTGREPLMSPDAAFIGYCKEAAKRNPIV